MVNYINTAPIHETWKTTVNNERWKLVEAPPATLNELLDRGELDLGFVSSFVYGATPEKYRILDDLSISASGPVGSVFLFSKLGMQDLNGEKVLLSNHSETSVGLVKIILEEFYSLSPSYITGGVMGEEAQACAAVLAIGDDALRLAASGKYPIQLDMGDVWFKHTGLPFVFAVCAVREEFCEEHPEELRKIHDEFLRCRVQGSTNLRDICEIVAPKIPMDCNRCHSYLSAIEYDLHGKKIIALERFFSYLIKRNEISSQAIPLKLFR